MIFNQKKISGDRASHALIIRGHRRFSEARAAVRAFAPSETSLDACAQSLLCLKAEGHRPTRAMVLERAKRSYGAWFS